MVSSGGGPSIARRLPTVLLQQPSRRDLGLPAVSAATFVVLAIALSLFQLYMSGVRPVGLFYARGFHLAVIQVLAFLLFPTKGRSFPIQVPGELGVRSRMAWTVDAALISGSIFAALYLTLNLDAIVNRAGAWSGTDVLAGVVAVVTLLEASRRALGWPISFIAVCFIGYGYAGPALPGVLRHGGYGTGRLVGQLYLGQEGIYGIPLGVAASFVFIFILFGALLEVTGAGPVLHRPGVRGHRKTEGRARKGGGPGLCRDGIRVGECHRQRRNQRGIHHSPHEEGRLPCRGGRGYRGGGKYGGSDPSPDHGCRSVPDRRVYRAALSGGRQGGTRSRDSLHGNSIRLRAPGGGQEGSQGRSSLRASPVRGPRWPRAGTSSWP